MWGSMLVIAYCCWCVCVCMCRWPWWGYSAWHCGDSLPNYLLNPLLQNIVDMSETPIWHLHFVCVCLYETTYTYIHIYCMSVHKCNIERLHHKHCHLYCCPQATRPDMIRILSAALHVVLRRDMSLNRRLYAWLLGAQYTHRHSSDIMMYQGFQS